MAATITIAFNGATATTTFVAVAIGQATMGIAVSQGIAATLSAGVTNISVTPVRVAIATAPGGVFKGDLSVLLDWESGQTPTVTLDNVAPGSAPPVVSWPTASGLEEQVLMSGNPLMLAGIVDES